MSLHRVDPRFVLPHALRRAAVLGLPEWRAGLEAAGVEVVERDTREALDLAVAPAARVAEARATGARSLLLEGAGGGGAANGAYRTSRVLLRPTRERPTLALPLDQPSPSAYALERWSVVDRRWKETRMHAARALVSRGIFPRWGSPSVTVATRETGPPAVVAAAGEVGVPADAGWFLTFGQGDSLSRNAFQLFPAGVGRPAWVLKFARVAGYSERFENDERGLELAQRAGGEIAERVPRLVGRFALDGVHASVETAAAGRRLRDLLATPADRAAKLRLIDRIAEWILELGRRTEAPPEAAAAERRRLQDVVVPAWRDLGVRGELVDAVPPLPSVLQHDDLGSWNVVVDGEEFAVVDWENAREHGFPLWDLLYFLADALVVLDGGSRPEELPRRVTDLFAGDSPSSPLLFSWTRRARESTGIPAAAVAPLAALSWLSHSHSFGAHDADLAAFTPGDPPRTHGIEGIARAWMAHPALAADWSAWRG